VFARSSRRRDGLALLGPFTVLRGVLILYVSTRIRVLRRERREGKLGSRGLIIISIAPSAWRFSSGVPARKDRVKYFISLGGHKNCGSIQPQVRRARAGTPICRRALEKSLPWQFCLKHGGGGGKRGEHFSCPMP